MKYMQHSTLYTRICLHSGQIMQIFRLFYVVVNMNIALTFFVNCFAPNVRIEMQTILSFFFFLSFIISEAYH